jgi:hypothetical protein
MSHIYPTRALVKQYIPKAGAEMDLILYSTAGRGFLTIRCTEQNRPSLFLYLLAIVYVDVISPYSLIIFSTVMGE